MQLSLAERGATHSGLLRSAKLLVLIACVLLAGAEFAYRGPMRALRWYGPNDLTTSFVASRLWLQGANPYDSLTFVQAWADSGGVPFNDGDSPTNTRPAYPPTALPLVAPLAAMAWPAVQWTLTLLTCALFVLMIQAVANLYGISWASNTGLALAAYTLALAPWQTAFAVVSPSVLAMEVAIVAAAARKNETGGVLSGLSLCLKPQIGLCFLLFDIFSKRWKRVAWATACVLAFSTIAFLRLPAGWLHSYRDNLHYFQAVGGVNDFTTANPIRFDLLNLQVILYFLFRDYRTVNLIAWGVAVLLLLICWRRKAGLAACVLVGLLPFYQRIYNAGLVVLVIGWGLDRIRHWSGKAVLLVSAIFLVPGGALLQRLHQSGRISQFAWEHNIALNLFLGPQATWAVLLLFAVMIWFSDQIKHCGGSPDQTKVNGLEMQDWT